MTHKEMFISQLNEAGITLDVDYTMTEREDGKVTTEVPFTERNKEKFFCNTLAIQGLIYHFQNSKWIAGDGYMAISQDTHYFRFL